jgi:hypothetical protein
MHPGRMNTGRSSINSGCTDIILECYESAKINVEESSHAPTDIYILDMTVLTLASTVYILDAPVFIMV